MQVNKQLPNVRDFCTGVKYLPTGLCFVPNLTVVADVSIDVCPFSHA